MEALEQAAKALYDAGRPSRPSLDHWNLDWGDPLLGEMTREAYREQVRLVLREYRAAETEERCSPPAPRPLTWDTDGLGAHRAWSDQLCVGAVVLRGAGQYWFDATYAVRMREIPGSAPSCGEAATSDEGKAALEHAWSEWLKLAGLST